MIHARLQARRKMVAKALTTTGNRALGRLALDYTTVVDKPCSCAHLGSLGDTTVTGQIVSKGVSLAVGGALTSAAATGAIVAGVTAVGGAAAGAAVGSVVPVIGTVIGAAIGFLTSKLFGKANYAAVYANIENIRALFQAYEQVAGQYPGRVYGWPEVQYIMHGAMVSGLFPGNGPPPGVQCTQAMISQKINACGTGQWIDDLLGSNKPGSGGSNNIANLIGHALSTGISDPITVVDQVVIPGLEQVALGKNNGWISIAHSSNPALYRQLLIDITDQIIYSVTPNLPVYYGTVPGATTAVAAPAPAPQQTATPEIGTTPTVAVSTGPQYSPATTIQAGSSTAISTPYGTLTFSAAVDSTGNYPLLANGNRLGSQTGVVAQWDGTSKLLMQNAQGAIYQWLGTQWQLVQAAPAANVGTNVPTPTSPVLPTSSGGLQQPTSVTQVGTDQYGNPVYQDQNGALWEAISGVLQPYSGQLYNAAGAASTPSTAEQIAQFLPAAAAGASGADYSDYSGEAAAPSTTSTTTTTTTTGVSPTVLLVGAGVIGLVALMASRGGSKSQPRARAHR